jgi:membrane fusion protein (multidrug efflux system)
VAADTAGKVAAVNVERGSRVRAGATLVVIDQRQARLMADEARTQIASARTRSALAQAECDRGQRLFELGALNRAEYDRRRAQCDDAAISVSAADIRQELAHKNLADALVKAPFDGIVADRFVNPGEYVRADSKVASVVQLDPLRLELSVPEEALSAFGGEAEVHFQVAAWPDDVFTGRVRYLGATVRRSTRDLLVEALVPNPDQRLRPGMFAIAQVVLGQIELPVVPQGSLRGDDENGTQRVFVVKDGRVEERLVQIGAAADGFVPIRAGLTSGERIVLSPSPELRDGVAVQ